MPPTAPLAASFETAAAFCEVSNVAEPTYTYSLSFLEESVVGRNVGRICKFRSGFRSDEPSVTLVGSTAPLAASFETAAAFFEVSAVAEPVGRLVGRTN